MIKVLDCTLRDGGYVIDWNFGLQTIQSIVAGLNDAGIDFIECGFLKECESNPDKTFFNSVGIDSFQNAAFMVNFGEYGIENFNQNGAISASIRVAFKKHRQKEALQYIKELVNRGWRVFANPMSTNTYSKDELSELIEEVNRINPYALSIVDTLGNMYEKQVVEIFSFIEMRLNPNIALGFHSHNSMQLSFSNTKALLKMGIKRDIIIDSCLFGMGRGAGNLCTELITKYLNDNYGKNYKILPILKVIDNCIKPFYLEKYWGYSTPYYIAAINGCHPNYAGYLVSKGLPDEEIDKILKQIPEDKKTVFDKEMIKKLCLQVNFRYIHLC